MNNTRFAVSIHILTLLAYNEEQWLSSGFMAESININPAMIRKELGNLQKHGLIKSRAGKYGGSTLAIPADKIKLSDIYEAVSPVSVLGTKRERPNPKCPVGNQINRHLNQLHKETAQAIVNTLSNQTLAEFCRRFI